MPPAPPGSDPRALPLLRRFCEELVADAMVEAGEWAPAGPAPAVDWARVWISEDTIPLEIAVARAVVASSQIAREIVDVAPGPPRAGTVRFTDAVSIDTPPPAPLVALRPAPAAGVAVPVEPVVVPAPTREGPRASPLVDRRLRAVFVAFGWVRNVGLILLLFAAWQLWGTAIEHSHAQQALRGQFQARVHQSVPPASGPLLVPATTRLPQPPEGSVVARLQIPAIGVDQYVVEGTAEGDLAKGPGHYLGTSLPGQAGNVAIAGHRTTYGAPFSNLDRLVLNDRITLTSDAGRVLTYNVAQAPVAVSPKDVSVLNTVGDNRLTLTTCNPKFSASQRLVVVALLVTPQAAPAPPAVKPRAAHIVADPTGWNLGYLPLALLVLALLVLLGLVNQKARHVYGRFGRWMVLVPIWTAGLYFLFELLTKLLPANL